MGQRLTTTLPQDKALSDDRLWAFLQGELDPAESLLIVTHCHLSCEGKKRITALAACAGAALETIEPQKMRCTAQSFFEEKCTKKPDEEHVTITRCPPCEIPKSLQPYLGTSYEAIDWQEVYPGIFAKNVEIPGSTAETRVLKVNKGTIIPEHRHLGDQLTLILRGALVEDGETYSLGDVSIHQGDTEETYLPHAPCVQLDCIVMTVMQGPLRLIGIKAKLLSVWSWICRKR